MMALFSEAAILCVLKVHRDFFFWLRLIVLHLEGLAARKWKLQWTTTQHKPAERYSVLQKATSLILVNVI